MFEAIEGWLTHTAWPTFKSFFGTVAKDELAAAAPVAKQAVTNLAAEEIAALKTGSTANAVAIAGKVAADTAAQLEQQGIQVGLNSVLTAVGAAVADVKAAP